MLQWRNRLFRLVCALMRDVATKSLRQLFTVVCKNLRVPLPTRNSDISHTTIEQVFRRKLGIHVNEDAFRCLPLARIAGNGVAVVEMWMTRRLVVHTAPAIELQSHCSVRRDVFHCA